jgi:formyl-CoA transferase
VWWQVQSRNKRSVALDLRQKEGQAIARQLIAEADVLVENFRPGTLEGWGMSPQELHQLNPGLVMLRISGYGQTGPYRDLPGFGAIGEAMGGLRHLTGEPGRVPVRVGVSIGDTLAALHGTIGVLTALYHRKVNGGQGQVIDVALHEAVFNVMESLIPEYSAFGVVREAAGSALPGIAPSNAYPCQDGWVLVAGNGDSIFKRLMDTIGRPDLGAAPDLADNAGRVARVARDRRRHWRLERAAHGAAGAGCPGQCPRARRQGLHRQRHCRRPALPRPRHAAIANHARRLHGGGARHRAQALGHARHHPQQRAAPG